MGGQYRRVPVLGTRSKLGSERGTGRDFGDQPGRDLPMNERGAGGKERFHFANLLPGGTWVESGTKNATT